MECKEREKMEENEGTYSFLNAWKTISFSQGFEKREP